MKINFNNLPKNLDAVLISSISNIIYLTDFSGFSEVERECFLVISKSNKFIITDSRYSEVIKKKLKEFTLIEIGAGNFIKNCKEFFKENNIKHLGFEENNLFYNEFKNLERNIKLFPINLDEIRTIKNLNEINILKKACKITDLAFEYIIKNLKLNITEKEASSLLENFIKNHNSDISFKPIIAFGKNSSSPHHQSGKTKLKKNSIVLIDFGVKYMNYCSDMTRTIYFGKPPEKFKKIYKTVLNSQLKAFEKIKINVNIKDIDEISRSYLIQNGYPSIPHSLGHGIGLEVHEKPNISPYSNDQIKNGMIFSLEPGVYIPNFGGIRIEDLVLVKNNKPMWITNSKKELIEL